MKNIISIVIINILALSSCLAGDQKSTGNNFKGLFIHYDGAEYERTFIECSSGDVWLVQAVLAYGELIKRYNTELLSKYGELYVEIKGQFSRIDKSVYPNSHYSGEIIVDTLLSHSSDLVVIDNCRK